MTKRTFARVLRAVADALEEPAAPRQLGRAVRAIGDFIYSATCSPIYGVAVRLDPPSAETMAIINGTAAATRNARCELTEARELVNRLQAMENQSQAAEHLRASLRRFSPRELPGQA